MGGSIDDCSKEGSPVVKSNDNSQKVASVERKEGQWHRGARRPAMEVTSASMTQREWEKKQRKPRPQEDPGFKYSKNMKEMFEVWG